MRLNDQLINLPNLYHVIDRSPITISPDSYLVDAIALMGQERSSGLVSANPNPQLNSNICSQPESGYVLVVKGTELLGIITKKDIVRAIATDINTNLSQVKVTEVMTRQLVTLKQSDSLDILTALLLLHEHRIHHLPIVDDQEQLVGIVTEARLLRGFDLVKMVGILVALKEHLQPSIGELKKGHQCIDTPAHRQIERVRVQTHCELQQWVEQQSAEVKSVCQELQQTLEELRVVEEELRQQNEELVAARESTELERQRYQDLFEFAPDAYLVTDTAGVIQEVNQAVTTMLGVSQQHLVNKPLIVFIAQQDRQSFREHPNFAKIKEERLFAMYTRE